MIKPFIFLSLCGSRGVCKAVSTCTKLFDVFGTGDEQLALDADLWYGGGRPLPLLSLWHTLCPGVMVKKLTGRWRAEALSTLYFLWAEPTCSPLLPGSAIALPTSPTSFLASSPAVLLASVLSRRRCSFLLVAMSLTGYR